ncbi:MULTISPECIES: agmatinase [Thermococcus]|uniref:Arginase n=2 Tax=Thermococcus sibiricus TaxID=172049 RepID=C6A3C8_THESM|nr:MULTISPECIES: agmatinase [Thermococcus]KUK29077.1 MAG: Arginase [Thermococcus sp. 40_45]HII68168.1 agmatinase [Thermococcaceae archaeon]ACS90123.1 Arginase [Thermococcus sibiricus MM 739]KUK18676.1 MAG: Arginase [Thermococcus sibiricus]MBC7094961.1 agmatinase [Thermococcus sp.]
MLFGIPPSEKPNLYILGIPWDNSSSYRRGCDKGPEAIREATSEELYNSFNESLVNLAEHWRYKDLGDVKVENFEELVERVDDLVKRHYTGELFLFLGGDHSITYATFRALKKVSQEEFGLIYFDAHPDLYPEYEGDKYSHACTVRRLVEEDLVKGKDVVQIGVRAPTKQQIEFAEEHGIKIISASEIYRCQKVDVPFKKAYLSFDMDVLDPAFAPGVGNPESGGLTTRELVEVIKSIKTEVVAFDVVELNPSYDYKGITAFAAAKIVREILGKTAKNELTLHAGG